MLEPFVTIASDCSLIEAKLLKSRLEENGNQAGLVAEPSPSGLATFGAFGNTFAVQVAVHDASDEIAVDGFVWDGLVDERVSGDHVWD